MKRQKRSTNRKKKQGTMRALPRRKAFKPSDSRFIPSKPMTKPAFGSSTTNPLKSTSADIFIRLKKEEPTMPQQSVSGILYTEPSMEISQLRSFLNRPGQSTTFAFRASKTRPKPRKSVKVNTACSSRNLVKASTGISSSITGSPTIFLGESKSSLPF